MTTAKEVREKIILRILETEIQEPDLGMMFIPRLHVLCKIYKDQKGLYIILPKTKERVYFKDE